jgi:bromodomain adjacent to zinc finger domain protein 1A
LFTRCLKAVRFLSIAIEKVIDRVKWREALSKGFYDAQCKQLTWSTDITLSVTTTDNGTVTEPTLCETISDFSKALLQIEQSVEKRFLRQPLGDVQKTPDKRLKIYKQMLKQKMQEMVDEDTQLSTDQQGNQVMHNWERSLMNCSSLSQLFIHLQTLDESIAWSKSALNARCRICRHKGDADKMLLCDKCDRGYHMYCLRPKLKAVPDGEWFCPDCKPKQIERTPRKIRLQNEEDFCGDEYEQSNSGNSEKRTR